MTLPVLSPEFVKGCKIYKKFTFSFKNEFDKTVEFKDIIGSISKNITPQNSRSVLSGKEMVVTSV
jgi:hypothetical protein